MKKGKKQTEAETGAVTSINKTVDLMGKAGQAGLETIKGAVAVEPVAETAEGKMIAKKKRILLLRKQLKKPVILRN